MLDVDDLMVEGQLYLQYGGEGLTEAVRRHAPTGDGTFAGFRSVADAVHEAKSQPAGTHYRIIDSDASLVREGWVGLEEGT